MVCGVAIYLGYFVGPLGIKHGGGYAALIPSCTMSTGTLRCRTIDPPSSRSALRIILWCKAMPYPNFIQLKTRPW